MNKIAMWVDQACSEIADWLPHTAPGVAVILAIVGVILAWMVFPLLISRIVVPRGAGQAKRRLRAQVADRWRGIIGKAFTVPPIVLAALYSLYQIGQMSQATRKAAEATFLETHKIAFDALAMDDVGHHIAAALALGQLLRTNPELREPILSALSSNTVAWSPVTPAASPPAAGGGEDRLLGGGIHAPQSIRADARTALNVIALRQREEEIDCVKKYEVEPTLWFEGGNFRGMPLPILRDEQGRRQPVQLDRFDFSGSDLSGSDLYCVSLGYANLNSTVLSGANLIEANLCGAHLADAKLRRGKNLASPGVSHETESPVLADQANFRGAGLQHAELVDARLREAVFDGARLDDADASGAVFECARAERARFSGATLYGSDFSNAFLKGADFTNAKIDDETTWDNANLESATFSGSQGLTSKLKKEKAHLCHTKIGDTMFDDNCNEAWSDPPEGCFTEAETTLCSPYSRVRSAGGLEMIRDLHTANGTHLGAWP